MKITKYGHSCLLVEEGKRILIDPGNLSFKDDLSPNDVGKVDAVLITHKHPDHLDPDLLKEIMEASNPIVIANNDTGQMLSEHGFTWQSDPGSLPISLVDSPHEKIPTTVPQNTGFLIGKLFHPGDSISPTQEIRPEVLALPIITPWITLIQSIGFAKRLNPKVVIPVHDGYIKYPDYIYNIVKRAWPEVPLQGTTLGKAVEVS